MCDGIESKRERVVVSPKAAHSRAGPPAMQNVGDKNGILAYKVQGREA